MNRSVRLMRPRALAIALSSLGAVVFALSCVLAYLFFSYLPYQESQMSELLSRLDHSAAATEQAFDSTSNELRSLEKKSSASAAFAAEQLAHGSPTYSGIVREWSPVVSLVACAFRAADGAYNVQSGSGMLVAGAGGSVEVWTNRHVLSFTSEDGKVSALTACTLHLPGSSITVDSNPENVFVADTIDFGHISIEYPSRELRSAATQVMPARACKTPGVIGEKIVILGFPSIGAESGITVTEGIISGIEGNHYVTSAKIESGNSGGIAVSAERNCYLGIPSFVKKGALESLGRILRWQAF